MECPAARAPRCCYGLPSAREPKEPRTHNRRMPVRRISLFDNFPDRGPVTLTWEENGATLTLEFMDGELVGKRQKPLK